MSEVNEKSSDSIAFFAAPLLAGAVLALIDAAAGGPYAIILLISGSVWVAVSLLARTQVEGLSMLSGRMGLLLVILAWAGYGAVWGGMWLAGEGGMP